MSNRFTGEGFELNWDQYVETVRADLRYPGFDSAVQLGDILLEYRITSRGALIVSRAALGSDKSSLSGKQLKPSLRAIKTPDGNKQIMYLDDTLKRYQVADEVNVIHDIGKRAHLGIHIGLIRANQPSLYNKKDCDTKGNRYAQLAAELRELHGIAQYRVPRHKK